MGPRCRPRHGTAPRLRVRGRTVDICPSTVVEHYCFVAMVWLSIGGLRDVLHLYRDLRAAKRDFDDDGTVRDHDFELDKDEETS